MDAIIHKTIEAMITLICLAPFAIAVYVTIIGAVAALFSPPQD